MLQVTFGRSKNFSDNLVENVKRGIRQTIRRGEWLTLAPFGYVNNYKTKNIEPDKVKSRIIKRAFEEYATGTYTLKSLADFLADSTLHILDEVVRKIFGLSERHLQHEFALRSWLKPKLRKA